MFAISLALSLSIPRLHVGQGVDKCRRVGWRVNVCNALTELELARSGQCTRATKSSRESCATPSCLSHRAEEEQGERLLKLRKIYCPNKTRFIREDGTTDGLRCGSFYRAKNSTNAFQQLG